MNATRPFVPPSIRVTLCLAFWGTVLVILAGSIVRTTGSGLGCPDWPHCFGQWIPPTSLAELPLDYKTRFQIGGREIADFSAFKTWVEYGNRLLGALLGLVLLTLSLLTIARRRTLPGGVLWGAQLALFLVVVQGGLGAVVVSTHLHGQTISLHLALALVLLVLLRRLVVASREKTFFRPPRPSAVWRWLGRLVELLALAQLALGTEVRKSLDHLVHEFVTLPRTDWAEHLNEYFLVHRTLALVFSAITFLWFWRSIKERLRLNSRFLSLMGLMVAALITGAVMRELGFPAWAQPLHLVLGCLIFVRIDEIYRHPLTT